MDRSEIDLPSYTDRRAGIGKRLTAAWVDCFIIYAITALLLALTNVLQARVALEPLYILVGAAYGAAMLARRGQTIGKMLAQIAVTVKAGNKLRLRHTLLREVLGKWGIGVAAPLALGRVLLEWPWASKVYDDLIQSAGLRDSPGVVLQSTICNVLVLSSTLLIQLVHYVIARRAWYDQMAGTVVERTAGADRRPRLAFAALVAAALLTLGTKAAEFAALGRVPCRLSPFHSMRSLKSYEAFLSRGQATPVDYIIGLFDRYDVVVLCERLHPEGSQWDFIYEVVSDPRFGDRVGHVFTEYGQTDMQSYLDEFMGSEGLDEKDIHDRAVHIMRQCPVWPVWINTNFYTYLTRLYALNQSLAPTKRIQHHFTDVSVKWPGLTKAGYWAYRRSLGNRDEQMAKHVIKEMSRLAEGAATRPKCLVVMNYRHAFDLTGRMPEAERFNTFEYLKDAFGDRAANVLLNTRILLVAPVAGGVWDAAFKQTGNRPAGFDLEASPFGNDPFDLFPFRPRVKKKLAYRDVFTGLVFTHPMEKQYVQHGVPGYFAGFEEEALRRAAFIGDGYRRIIQTLIDSERSGDVAVKIPVPDREGQVELSLMGLLSIGLFIGAWQFAFGWRAERQSPGLARTA